MQRFVTRSFTSSARSLFKNGTPIPAGIKGLQENAPSNSIDIAAELASGKHIVVGLPAAFSPACSASHVPGYIAKLDEIKAKGYNVFVTSVNDSFVMKAWAQSLAAPSEIRFIADTAAEFAKAGDYLFESAKIFGNDRSKRYALIVEDGKVVKEFVEPDNIGVNVSSAENVLKNL